MKRFVFVVVAVAVGVVAVTASGADIYRETISCADAGPQCSTILSPKTQYAVQCDAGLFIQVCQSDGGCPSSGVGGVHVDPNALYDIVVPGGTQFGRVCAQPDVVAGSSCKLFLVDPPQLKVAP